MKEGEEATPRKRFRLLKGLAVLAVTLLVTSLLAEGLVLLVLGEQVKFPRRVVGTDFGLRVNQPNAVYRHKSPDVEVWFRINRRGMRADRDYPYEKPAGVKRILSLGDSFTVGYEVEVEECFSSVLERELRERGFQVEVLNAGVSGYSTAEECLYLERELLKYDPDVVLVSFYSNDIRDNIRTDLFRIDGETGELVQRAESYVPMGRMANFLNTNPILSWLSQYSNAFALLKEQTTLRLKKKLVRENAEEFAQEVRQNARRSERAVAQRGVGPKKQLTCSIYERMRSGLAERGIPLVVQTIPHEYEDEEGGRWLIDEFPFDCFDVDELGVPCLQSGEVLEPFVGEEQLYWKRSHKHWTPFAHDVAGKALAELVAPLLEDGQ